ALPEALDRDVAGRAAPVLAHPARDERRRRVAQHLRIAAKHDMGRFRRELETRGLLEAPIGDCRRDAARERAGRVLAADEADVARLCLPDELAIRQLARV